MPAGALAGAGIAAMLVPAVIVAAAPARPPAGQERQPTFAVTVELVTTDVIPRDQAGRFVADLARDEFEVLEDGVRQDIVSFVLVHGGRTFNLVRPTPPPAPEGIVLPSAPPPPDVAGRVFLIVADDLHLQAQDTPHVRKVLKQIVATLVHEGDVCALITTGPSAVEVDYTYDRRRLEAAISRVTGHGLTFADLTTTSEGASGPADLRRRASAALATVYNAINALDQIHDKRKVVLFVSAGYDFDPFPEARRGTDKVFGGRYGTPARDLIEDSNPFFRSPQITADVDLAAQLVEVALAANRTNASIFTIDPRGPGRHHRCGPADRHDGVGHAPAEDAEQPPDAGRADRRGGARQPERLRTAAEAGRRGDERLLRPRLLFQQSGPDAACATDRGAGDASRGRGRGARLVRAQAEAARAGAHDGPAMMAVRRAAPGALVAAGPLPARRELRPSGRFRDASLGVSALAREDASSGVAAVRLPARRSRVRPATRAS